MKRIKKILVVMLTLVYVICNMTSGMLTAKAETYINKASSINFTEAVSDIIGVPGETVHVKLPIRAVGGYIFEPKISVVTENMPFTVSKVTYTAEGYTAENPPAGISNISTTYIEFDLKVKETATISRNKLQVKIEFTAQNLDNAAFDEFTLSVPSIYLVIEKEKEPTQLTVNNIVFDNAVIGNKTEISFVIKNEGDITAHNAYFNVEGYDEAKIIPGYSKLKQEIGKDGKLASGESFRVHLPVMISANATAGTKTLTVNMDYKNADGKEYTVSNKIYINIGVNTLSPKLEIVSTKYASELKTGDAFNFVATLRNLGISTAREIEVIIEGLGTTSFIPNYTTEVIEVGNLAYDKTIDVKIPLIVSKEATGGIKKIDLKINYKDEGGVVYSTASSVYLEVVAADGLTAEGKPNIVVSNVSQSPASPNAGARVDVYLDLENKSNIDISELKIAITNLSSANFSPVNSEPYQYIEKLAGGRKARITIPLTVSEAIPEGMGNLELQYEYKDSNGKEWKDTANIYVLDIQNNNGVTSKPKLIISNFTTDIEELRAGNTFNFIFDIYNTHSNIDAKNIKVTVSQADNIFAVTKGSNTFYITKINAGETVQNSIELKVKSDAVTKAYPIEIKMEYEYDGAEVNPTTGEIGETVKETINLQAVENSRPVVDNVFVGSWDMPVINHPTALTFEFYNMGKSTLNNVHATVEGDFYLSTGSMYFIGNVQAGYSEHAELEVIPTVEGMAKGTLVITFEDSNGNEVSVTKEFEAAVQGEYIPDYNGGDMGGGMDPIIDAAKKPILPTWLFVIVQIAIIIVFIPVTRKVILGLHRKKLRKLEEVE